MTEKLYDRDSTLQEFDCKVIGLYNINDTTLGVETDRTAFFPEGGGQTSDRGVFFVDALTPAIHVENVQIDTEHLLHFVENSEENVKSLKIGTLLHGKIDWEKRFSDMQQHSGEHILSGIVHRLYGFSNVGFHLSAQEVTVDFDGELSENDICKVESLVNKTIWQNLEIHAWYPSETDLLAITYRSKKEIDGPLRLVEIPSVDICACCAPHVRHTGEIGLLRVVQAERHRGGTRLWILCGARAMEDAAAKLKENHKVGVLLSAKQTETFAAVQRLKEKNAALSFALVGTQRELLALRAKTVTPQTALVEQIDADGTLLRDYADLLADKADAFAAVFSAGDDMKFVIISKHGFALAPVAETLRSTFGAKCGGRGGVLQGALCGAFDAVRATLETIAKQGGRAQ